MVILDTNAILRYILQDIPTMADEVELQLSNEICFIPIEVIAEIVYVLSKVYGVERDVITKVVTNIIYLSNISIPQIQVVYHALCVYASSTFDFVDCLLIGYSKEDGYSIFTFDNKIRKYLNKNK